jgi:hypothetical protein
LEIALVLKEPLDNVLAFFRLCRTDGIDKAAARLDETGDGEQKLALTSGVT